MAEHADPAPADARLRSRRAAGRARCEPDQIADLALRRQLADVVALKHDRLPRVLRADAGSVSRDRHPFGQAPDAHHGVDHGRDAARQNNVGLLTCREPWQAEFHCVRAQRQVGDPVSTIIARRR
jgi:hypothetical protein